MVAPADVQAAIAAAYRDLDQVPAPVPISIARASHDGSKHEPAVLVKAGPLLLWALDPYEAARVEWALYGSEPGSRLGDD